MCTRAISRRGTTTIPEQVAPASAAQNDVEPSPRGASLTATESAVSAAAEEKTTGVAVAIGTRGRQQ